jgi:hypothetical protein
MAPFRVGQQPDLGIDAVPAPPGRGVGINVPHMRVLRPRWARGGAGHCGHEGFQHQAQMDGGSADVSILVRALVGILLIAHGLVHMLYLAPEANDPRYPFTLRSSWLVPEAARRPTASVLIAATATAFVLLALAVWGVPGLSGAWPVPALVASAASLGLLIAFWDTRLLAGVVIDLALVALALIRPGWTQLIGR